MKGLDQSYHLVFYDQRGSLLSPCPPDNITIQKHVDDLEKLRVSLGLSQMNLVAHSMGTFLAMDYQSLHPDQVKGLVLLGAMLPRTPKSEVEAALLQSQQKASSEFIERPEIDAALKREGLDREPAALTPQQQTTAWRVHFAAANIYHLERTAQVRGGKAFYNSVSGQAAAKTMPHEWNFTPALAKRTCSTWVIDGDHDYADPGGKSFSFATQAIPGVHVITLKDAGHLSWIDAGDTFTAALRSAVQSSVNCTKAP
jgi:pimeloyl-ACP methyl ester carboxylesterase